jgi:hypothetical protein
MDMEAARHERDREAIRRLPAAEVAKGWVWTRYWELVAKGYLPVDTTDPEAR